MDERTWPKGFNILLPIFPLCALLDALCMYEKANQTKLLEAKYVAVKVLYNFNRRIHKWIFLCWIWYNKRLKSFDHYLAVSIVEKIDVICYIN